MPHLDTLDDEVLAPTLKGLAQRAVGRRLSELGSLGLTLSGGEIPFPAAVLKESALAHNGRWMRDFTQRAGVRLCPHGKTTMSPQLFGRQLADGCWGITAATASHVRTYRHFGVPRVILANQLLDAANLGVVLDELDADPRFECFMLVDSLAGLARMQEILAGRPPRRPLQLLLEVGALGGRTGVRTLEEGVALGRAVRDGGAHVVLRGIETFEGIWGGPDHAKVELRALAMIDAVVALARAGIDENWFAPGEVILSAGGSAFFDLATKVLREIGDERIGVILRSGCYLSHDTLHYARMQARMRERAGAAWGAGPGLRNALEVWSVVQSQPEPGRAIVALGKRDISYDIELPQPLAWMRPGVHAGPVAAQAGMRVTALNDQHAFVDCEGPMPWAVGDLVGFGVAHPCTTFDKWPLLHVVDDSYRVTGGVRTYF